LLSRSRRGAEEKAKEEQKPLKRKDANSQRFFCLLKLRVLAQFGIKGRISAGKKPFDGERPRVSSRLKGFKFFIFKTTSYKFSRGARRSAEVKTQ
jgi:hypothetical protein